MEEWQPSLRELSVSCINTAVLRTSNYKSDEREKTVVGVVFPS
jgi:hypothetical protein